MTGRHRMPVQRRRFGPEALMLGIAFASLIAAAKASPAETAYSPGSIKAAVLTQPAAQPAPKPVRVPTIVGERGLAPNAIRLAHYIQAAYPGVLSIGGVRPCDPPYNEHCRGVALDIMVGWDVQLGNQIDADILANAERFGVKFTLWQHRERKPSGAVYWVAPRGGPTQDHMDHVHVRVAA